MIRSHSVCAGEFTPEQLDAWADGRPDLKAWARSLSAHDTLVAEGGGTDPRLWGYDSGRAIWTVCSCTGRPRAGGSPPALCAALEGRCSAPGVYGPRVKDRTDLLPEPGIPGRAGTAGGTQRVLLANFVMTRPASEGTKKNKRLFNRDEKQN